MYTGLLHSHKLFVVLFLVHYVVKLLLLQLGKTEQLAKYTKATKVAEMIISFGFLATGIGMLVKGAAVSNLFYIKLVCVFASIPIAVIGFKKGNKALATLAVVLIIAAYGLAEMSRAKKSGTPVDTTTATSSLEVGKQVYGNSCVTCHGADGKLGLSGAKELGATQLTAEEQKTIIRNGKNAMPAHSQLTDEQVNGVVEYIATFKQ